MKTGMFWLTRHFVVFLVLCLGECIASDNVSVSIIEQERVSKSLSSSISSIRTALGYMPAKSGYLMISSTSAIHVHKIQVFWADSYTANIVDLFDFYRYMTSWAW